MPAPAEATGPEGADGGDFAARPAASHQPAALWQVKRLLVSVLVFSGLIARIIP